ncbi:IMS-domain-containing protein [Hygrophoropsis aurantiaca]|uniref:IMS-domain-containing protein n=1 Tax=Hygrophoropsis aurantiaca TaxID=72124 RepID=A0ACB8AU92_9AGAM|nr:IMS-domain-containing protein [Hygrophoropsis aurantiaca]
MSSSHCDPQPPKPSPDSASLLKRLAGPSSTKAGLAKDQTEINRIIAEASKGSKFYEASKRNEKRKDKELSDRIAKILKQRDDVLQGVDIASIFTHNPYHTQIEELEFERDLSQIIIHVDMDAFYANVELLHDPTLEGKPFGASQGVLSTASYEARKYGVRSGMAAFVAKKLCPELIILKLSFSRYSELSDKIMDILRRYDPTMHTAGCDEGYLNITDYCRDHQLNPDECVQHIRATVHKETQLTVSAGIASNKMLAKICSDKNKPNGQYHLPFERDSIKEFMHDLSIRKVPGVGRVNERLLDAIGIKTCGDIYTHRATISLMDKQFGLRFLLRTYLGIASNVVQPGQREERKSIGAERTFHALSDKQQIFNKLEEVAAELSGDMDNGGWTGKTVTLKYKLDTYQVFTRAKSFDRWVSSKKEDLFAVGKELLIPELPVTIRLIGLRVTKLKDLRAKSPPSGGIKRFFEPTKFSPRKKPRLEDAIDIDDDDVQILEPDEDSMPGFYEEGDVGGDDEIEGRSHDGTHSKPPSRQAQSHVSSSIAGPSHPTSGHAGPSRSTDVPQKPRSSRAVESHKPNSKSTDEGSQGHVCPICGKRLDTDNQGLNAHIDFCLSKGVIMEATTETSSPQKKGNAGLSIWNSAPKSKRKR